MPCQLEQAFQALLHEATKKEGKRGTKEAEEKAKSEKKKARHDLTRLQPVRLYYLKTPDQTVRYPLDLTKSPSLVAFWEIRDFTSGKLFLCNGVCLTTSP
jgi:hypothetical protein